MTKWVEDKDVVFTCQSDVYEYLLADKIHAVRGKISGITIYFENGDLMPFNYFGNFKIISDWIPMKRAEWYEDIPEQGVLCWAGHQPIDLKYKLCIVIKEHDGYFLTSNNELLKYVLPLTKEEVLQYILPG